MLGHMTATAREPGSIRSSPSSRIRRILLATDLTPTSDAPTTRAMQLATDLGASLLAVHVIEPGSRGPLGRRPQRIDQVRAERETAMLRLISDGRNAGVVVDYLIWHGDPGESIVEASLAEAADLIVVGTHARSLAGRALIGSVSDHVVREAAVPVLIVR